jgi:diaminohydroxyphosphoribosylaminopyrimidine deaminase/5-amino-6-(5-phosphoribosylamino)uracil reductase
MKSLYRYDIGSVLVEGGREVFSQFLRHGPVDELSIFLAPTVMGHGISAMTNVGRERSTVRFSRWSAMPVGRDILIQAFR